MRNDFAHEYEQTISRIPTEMLIDRMRQEHPDQETQKGWRSMDLPMVKQERPRPVSPPPQPGEVQAVQTLSSIIAMRQAAWDLVAHIADKHEVAVADVFSKCRRKNVVHARHEAFAFIHDHAGIGASTMGRIFRRDHSSVLSGISSHRRRVQGGGHEIAS